MSGIKNVFANKTLDMGQVKALGWDFDDTLIRYTPAKQTLVLHLTKEIIKKETGYDLGDIEEDELNKYQHLFRGTLIDRQTGYFLHINSDGRIRDVYYGTERISKDEWSTIERYKWNFVNLHDTNFLWIDSIDRVIDGILLSKLLDQNAPKELDSIFRGKHFEELVGSPDDDVKSSVLEAEVFDASYATNFVRVCIDKVHRDFSMKNEIMNSLDGKDSQYIEDPSHIPELVEHFGVGTRKKHAKKFSLITNSEPIYVKKVMDHYFGEEWKNWFKQNVYMSRKPGYFREDDRKSEDYEGKRYKGRPQLYATLKELRLEHPSQMLYIGDNIYADILAAKELNVQTCAIIHELEEQNCTEVMDRSPKFRSSLEKATIYAARASHLTFLDRGTTLTKIRIPMRHEMFPSHEEV